MWNSLTMAFDIFRAISGWADDAQAALSLPSLFDIESWLSLVGLDGSESRGFAVAGACVAIAAFVLLVVLVLARTSQGRATGVALAELTRGPRRFGYAAAFLLVAVFGGWSLLAPLASAAIAPGVVSPDGSRKTVEHFEGGIVRTIHVREGDEILEGMPLVTLDDVQARSRLRETREQYFHLLAIEGRLNSERADRDSILIPIELAVADEQSVRQMILTQSEVLKSRRATQAGRENILTQRIRQLEEQNEGLSAVIRAEEEQIALIAEEIEAVEKLYKRGLEKYPRLLALKRAQADLEAQKSSNRARIAENMERIGETELQLLNQREQMLERANAELAEVQRQIATITSQMPSREDILERTVIRAPISGTVMNIRPTTVTGVIRPGEPILEIVPRDGSLIIDAKVRPDDIDRVYTGMKARVVLTAYQQRNLPQIHGTVRSISADRLIESQSGHAYFLAKVEVRPEDLAQLEDVKLTPGMPTEVMILNGERTLFDYMLGPILHSMSLSFKSD